MNKSVSRFERYFSFFILAIASFSVLPLLGLAEIFQSSEAREGTVIREILNSWEFVLPLRNGEIVPSKPILFHWLGAALAILFGHSMDEFYARLPSALAAVLCVLIVSISAKRVAGLCAGYLAALILCSTYGFIHLAQDSRVDMVFCLFSTASFIAWFVAYLEKRESWKTHLVAAILSGLAILAKGPLGVVLPVMGIGVVTCYRHGFVAALKRAHPIWLIAFVISAPWYLAAASHQGFVSRQLIFENISRFFGGEGINEKPFWFYLVYLWTQAAPWAEIFALTAIAGICRRKKLKEMALKFLPKNESERKIVVSLFLYMLAMFIFFSIASGKRRAYLLPTLPIMAFALSICFSRLSLSFLTKKNLAKYYYAFLSFLILLGPALFVLTCLHTSGAVHFPAKVTLLFSVVPDIFSTYKIALVSLYSFYVVSAFLLLKRALRAENGILLAISLYLFMQLGLSVYKPLGLAIKAKTHSYKSIAPEIDNLLPSNTKLNIVKTKLDEAYDGFLFYYAKHVTYHNPEVFDLKPGYYLAHEEWFEQYSAKHSNSSKVLYKKGRVIEKPGKQLYLFQIAPHLKNPISFWLSL